MSTVFVRNKSGESRYVPSLGRDVEADEVVEVLASEADSLTCQSIWEAVKAKKSADAPASK